MTTPCAQNNVILQASCACAKSGTTPVCEKDSVCFKSDDATAVYTCATGKIEGPKATTDADKNKFCAKADKSKVSLITGAGYCDEEGAFTANCATMGEVIAEGTTCMCGTATCAENDVCFNVDKTLICAEEIDDNDFAQSPSYALVGDAKTPTLMKFGQYYDAKTKSIIETCNSQFTQTSTTCVCNPAAAEADKVCKEKQFCDFGNCLPIAAMKTKLTAASMCGSESCAANSYCMNFDKEKTALDPGSACIAPIAGGKPVSDAGKDVSSAYCTVEGKEGMCYGKDTTCTTDNGCTCASSNDSNKISYGVCYVSGTKTCTLGQTWDGTDCKDPAAPGEGDIVHDVVIKEGGIKCGNKVIISDMRMQGCYKSKVYPACLNSISATTSCLCAIGGGDEEHAMVTVISKGAACTESGVLCTPGYKYTDDKHVDCKKSGSGGLGLGAIIGIVVGVVVVVAAVVVGVVCGLKKKSGASAIEKKPTNGEEVVSPAQ